MKFAIGEIAKLKLETFVNSDVRGACVRIKKIETPNIGVEFLENHGFFKVDHVYNCNVDSLQKICGEREELE